MPEETLREPIRPRSHILEDISRDRVKSVFHEAGWVTVDLSPDYGEDALVFVYEANCATGELFFVQLKSVSSDRYYSRSHDFIRYPLKVASLRRWERLSLPVVLVTYVYASGKCYWLVIQSYLREKGINPAKIPSNTISIHVPLRNVLANDTLLYLRQVVSELFRRLKKPELMSLREVLKHVESQLDIIATWADKLETEKKAFDEALHHHEKEQIAKFPSLYRLHGRVSHASPERSYLYRMLRQRVKQIPRKKVAKALVELRQVDPKLAMLQTMLLERYPSGSIQALVTQLSQLQLVLATIANGLGNVLQSSVLVTVPWDAREISWDIQRARAVIEQMKWAAFDLVLGAPDQNKD